MKKISSVIRFWLFICIICAFFITNFLLFCVQNRLAENDCQEVLATTISDIKGDIRDNTDYDLLWYCDNLKEALENLPQNDSLTIETLCDSYLSLDIGIINLIDENGIIYYSTDKTNINYNMYGAEQSRQFMENLIANGRYAQPMMRNGLSNELYKYVGITLDNGEYLQIGNDAEEMKDEIEYFINIVAKNRHVGKGGSVLIADSSGRIITDAQGVYGKTLQDISLDLSPTDAVTVFQKKLFGKSFQCMYDTEEGYTILAIIPTAEILQSRNVALTATMIMEVIVFAILYFMVMNLFSKLVVKNLKKVNRTLSEITKGNLDAMADVHGNLEFSSLSDHINVTVTTLKQYIAEAEERNMKDLELAKTIQLSTMPKDFFTDAREFRVFASMDTAKEVGGDFYDLFYVDDHTFNIVIADVSGKGIPAALFMMRAKTLIKSLATRGIPPHEVFRIANNQLCEENDAEMFVTAWMASIDLNDGHVVFANAGHNPPLIKRADGNWEYLSMQSGFVLAGIPDIPYKPQMLQLAKGDTLYLYTDGVTEATRPGGELYGEDRLRHILDTGVPAAADGSGGTAGTDMETICASVRADVDVFAAEEPQADDITMLAFNFIGKREPLVICREQAEIADITEITDRVNEELNMIGCTQKARTQLDIAIDEIYSNIVKNAYPESKGPVSVTLCLCNDGTNVMLTFTDNGVPYNPLRKEDPDITLSIEEREIGGLGIFMAKKAVDEMSYEYKDEMNILKLRKKIQP